MFRFGGMVALAAAGSLLPPCNAFAESAQQQEQPADSAPTEAYGRQTGVEIALRVGYGLPTSGSLDLGVSRGDGMIKGVMPVQLDVGYSIVPGMMTGAYLQVAPGLVDCSFSACGGAYDVRVGVQAHVHFYPARKADPWVGAGLGYEWLHSSYSWQESLSNSGPGPSGSSAQTLNGFEFNFQAGLDFRMQSGAALGPVVTYALGKFSSCASACVGSSPPTHTWLMLGLRMSFIL